MKWLRTAFVLALLLCLAPMISVFIAGAIADHYGCRLHEGFVNPCVVNGNDIGTTLYNMGMMGWFMLFTLPIGALIILAWVISEIVNVVRRRRASSCST
ncbi:MAG: hypothetical protein KDJ47_19580 [Hyphomicrobiaceae bacterium]|nr:hypothetical protein [Hyphomicrobiaceae bacterium]